MGHERRLRDYPENINKTGVQRGWDNYVAHADWQEGASGLCKDIRWYDDICESREEAEKFIEDHDSGWYDQLAVRYKVVKNLEKSKTYHTLKERYDRLQARYDELNDNIHYGSVKSKFITCRSCESRISTEILRSTVNKSRWYNRNLCPVCGKDLRPESALQAIKNAKENAAKAEKDLHEEEKKLQKKQEKKAEIRWLVKVEWHE